MEEEQAASDHALASARQELAARRTTGAVESTATDLQHEVCGRYGGAL